MSNEELSPRPETIRPIRLLLWHAPAHRLRPQARPKLRILLANVAAHALAHVLRMIPGDCRVLKLDMPEVFGGWNVHFLFIGISHFCAEVLEESDVTMTINPVFLVLPGKCDITIIEKHGNTTLLKHMLYRHACSSGNPFGVVKRMILLEPVARFPDSLLFTLLWGGLPTYSWEAMTMTICDSFSGSNRLPKPQKVAVGKVCVPSRSPIFFGGGTSFVLARTLQGTSLCSCQLLFWDLRSC